MLLSCCTRLYLELHKRCNDLIYSSHQNKLIPRHPLHFPSLVSSFCVKIDLQGHVLPFPGDFCSPKRMLLLCSCIQGFVRKTQCAVFLLSIHKRLCDLLFLVLPPWCIYLPFSSSSPVRFNFFTDVQGIFLRFVYMSLLASYLLTDSSDFCFCHSQTASA